MSSLLYFELGAHKIEHKIRNTKFGSSLLLRNTQRNTKIKKNWGRNRYPSIGGNEKEYTKKKTKLN